MRTTAVEWLAEQITTIKWKMSDITDRQSIINQAKAMEKEQIEKAFDAGVDSCNYGFQWADGEMYFETEYLN